MKVYVQYVRHIVDVITGTKVIREIGNVLEKINGRQVDIGLLYLFAKQALGIKTEVRVRAPSLPPIRLV